VLKRSTGWRKSGATLISIGLTTLFASLQGTSIAGTLSCDESLKGQFAIDPNTTVTLVRLFKKGDNLSLDGTPTKKTAARDLCMVKLNVGPGNPGPAGAPSTSRGIGIEIWLPSPWNGRVHVIGGGGFVGNADIGSLTQLGTAGSLTQAYETAGEEGSVSAVTDTGHVAQGRAGAGSFAMLPDGGINKVLWTDFASRGIHETAVKTKALAAIYYGTAAKYSYFDGCSTGGRQGHMEAQRYPEDFDGILVGDAALNWTRFIPAELYPQIVMQRDLGGAVLTAAQLDLVSSSAVSACDTDLNGQHAGYISDPAACRYDPTKDRTVLCKADGGSNETAACVSPKQANAINKMWFGQTVDGTVPSPATANGYAATLLAKQLWFGPTRGTQLAMSSLFGLPGLAGSANGVPLPFSIATDQVALNLQQATLSTPAFQNATRNGADGWKALSYADMARAQSEGANLDSELGGINTDDPNLTKFRDRGGKMLFYYGMADQLIPIQGSTRYYESAAEKLGGYAALQRFYRYYPIPGMGHCLGTGSVNGVAGVSPAANPPLPAPGQLFAALTDWVEKSETPEGIVLHNANDSTSRPLCPFPTKLRYVSGDRALATSYVCKN
jgi:Tannase and feruloyl esterase